MTRHGFGILHFDHGAEIEIGQIRIIKAWIHLRTHIGWYKRYRLLFQNITLWPFFQMSNKSCRNPCNNRSDHLRKYFLALPWQEPSMRKA